jgi:hypothetical protein
MRSAEISVAGTSRNASAQAGCAPTSTAHWFPVTLPSFPPESTFGMFRFETAGESHGECLVATLTGLPAGIPISVDAVNHELWRRQQGYGRGGRMKIETDRAEIVAGVRHSKTIGAPIAIIIQNKDWKNWTEALPVEGSDDDPRNTSPSRGRVPDMPIWPAA